MSGYKFGGEVTDVPDNFKAWVRDNQDRIERARSKPYFLTDNGAFDKQTGKYTLNEFGRGTAAGNGQRKDESLLTIYPNSLQSFVDKVFDSKKTNNTVKELGGIDNAIIKDMASKKITITDDRIFISDKKALKYLDHPKNVKGAVIDKNKWADIEKSIKNPTAIYEDLKSKELVYVYENKYDKEKSLKIIVHPNYKLNGSIINMLKSIGIVDSKQLSNAPLYFRKIK